MTKEELELARKLATKLDSVESEFARDFLAHIDDLQSRLDAETTERLPSAKPTKTFDDPLTVADAATISRKNKSQISRAADAGTILSTGKGKERRICRSSVIAWMKSSTTIRPATTPTKREPGIIAWKCKSCGHFTSSKGPPDKCTECGKSDF